MSSSRSDSLPTQSLKMPSLFIEVDNYNVYKGNYTSQNFSPGALEHPYLEELNEKTNRRTKK